MRQPGEGEQSRRVGAVLRAEASPWAVQVRTTTGREGPAVDVSRLGDVVEELVCRLEGEVGNISSTIGLSPAIAAPSASPLKPFSAIGVLKTRSGATTSASLVDPYAPRRDG
jgi:hypothetical protein